MVWVFDNLKQTATRKLEKGENLYNPRKFTLLKHFLDATRLIFLGPKYPSKALTR